MGAGDREVTWVDREVQDTDGSIVTRSVPQSSDGFVPGLTGQRSYRCVICGLAYKEEDVRIFRGKPYCIPGGCADDIESILMKERAGRLRKSSGTEQVSHFTEGG